MHVCEFVHSRGQGALLRVNNCIAPPLSCFVINAVHNWRQTLSSVLKQCSVLTLLNNWVILTPAQIAKHSASGREIFVGMSTSSLSSSFIACSLLQLTNTASQVSCKKPCGTVSSVVWSNRDAIRPRPLPHSACLIRPIYNRVQDSLWHAFWCPKSLQYLGRRSRLACLQW